VAKTGIEILTELVEQVRLLNKRIDLLDQNVKTLMNKTREQKPAETKIDPKPQIQAIDPPPPKQGKMTILTEKPRSGVMTSGRLVVKFGDKQTPIADASIKIFNDKDVLVRETKTNRGGIWMCLLPAGKYVAEITGKFRGKDLITQNKNFTIPDDGRKEFEVI